MAELPQIFISATTADLRSVRDAIKAGLLTLGCHPVEQAHFGPDAGTIREILARKIAECDAVLHVAGACYGTEPPHASTPGPRRSHTQREYDLARELKKPLYIFICADGFPYDAHPPEPDDLSRLQQGHRRALLADEQRYELLSDLAALDLRVRELGLNVEKLRGQLVRERRRWTVGLRWAGAGLALIGVALIGQQSRSRRQENDLRIERQRTAALEQRVQQNELLVQLILKRASEPGLGGRDSAESAILRAQVEVAAETGQSLDELKQKVDGSIQSALRLAQSLHARNQPARDEERRAWLAAGDAQLAGFRLEEAEKSYRSAVALFDRAGEPRAWAGAQTKLATSLQEQARFQDAASIREEVLAVHEKEDGAESTETATALVELAAPLTYLDRYTESEPLLRRALAIREKVLGPEHTELAVVLTDLADVLRDTDRPVEAEPLYRRALSINELRLGPDHPDVACVLDALAGMLRFTNRLAEAEPLYRRALAIDEKHFGPDHPDVAIRLNNFAIVLDDTNHPAEAEPLLRRALAIQQKSRGPDHPEVATVLNNLARLFRHTNRLAEAEPLFRRALEIHEKCLPPDHPDIATNLSNLAIILKDTHRPSEAEPLLRRALEIDEKCFGPDHPNVASDLNNLGQVLRALDHLTEAGELYRHALAIDEKSGGPNHTDVATDLVNLGSLLRDTDHGSDAEPLIRRALAIDEKSLGREHPSVARDLHALAQALAKTGRDSEAEPLFRRTLWILAEFQRRSGHEHRDFPETREHYRQCLVRSRVDEPGIEQRIASAQTEKPAAEEKAPQ